MAATNSNVKAVLRQLDKSQLGKLAKKKAKKTALEMNKPQLVEFLSHIVTKKEINEVFANHGRTGDKAVIDGQNFEVKALNYLKRQGWNCHLRDKSIKGMEFDVVGTQDFDRTSGWGFAYSTFHLLAECKHRKVNMVDFSKFLGKFEHYKKVKKTNNCKGYLITSAIFDPQVKKAAKSHKNIIVKNLKV
jgi:hypothetical protein